MAQMCATRHKMQRIASYMRDAKGLLRSTLVEDPGVCVEYCGRGNYAASPFGMALVGKLRDPRRAAGVARSLVLTKSLTEALASELGIPKSFAQRFLMASNVIQQKTSFGDWSGALYRFGMFAALRGPLFYGRIFFRTASQK
jgi:hypothetical protein